MIFVVLGTHELPFTRLLNEVERLKKDESIKDEIIVQNGHTKFNSEVLKLIPFVEYDEMDKLFEQADLVITHAGTGSVITALKKGKKVIAAPRLEKYGEHNDDHQLQLVEGFVNNGHILAWNENDALEDVIEKVKTFTPKPFQSKRDLMFKTLKDFIDTI